MTSRTLAGLVVLLILACGLPASAAAAVERSTFEGFEVVSEVPERPRGLVHLFHGSNGSAGFADQLETRRVLARLTAQGYGFVSTSSTQRTGNRRWNVRDPSMTSNPDLARLERLQTHLVATTPVEASTPLFGIGTSNGARFVTLWGQAFRTAGHPVAAIWASMGRTATPVAAPGALTVPTVFTTAENDFTSPPGPIVASRNAARAAGVETELYVSRERRLTPAPYRALPGVNAREARRIVGALKATGVWNARGRRIEPDVQRAIARFRTAVLPASVRRSRKAIERQTGILLAVHRFTDEFTEPVLRFFDRHAR